jgi:phosphohistidine phosphatase SixA
MGHIYLVRHGAYSASGGLSPEGREQIKRAAQIISTESKSTSSDGNIVVSSSASRRAKESGKIISAHLGVDVTQIRDFLMPVDEIDRGDAAKNTILLAAYIKKVVDVPRRVEVFVSHGPTMNACLSMLSTRRHTLPNGVVLRIERGDVEQFTVSVVS